MIESSDNTDQITPSQANPQQAEKPKRRGNNQTGRNQWTKLRNAGSEETRRKLEAWRDRYKAHSFIAKLADHANGKVELSSTQIKSIELVLDRLEPRLSSVEATHISPDARKTPEELRAELVALLKSDPSIAREAGFVPLPPQAAPDPQQDAA